MKNKIYLIILLAFTLLNSCSINQYKGYNCKQLNVAYDSGQSVKQKFHMIELFYLNRQHLEIVNTCMDLLLVKFESDFGERCFSYSYGEGGLDYSKEKFKIDRKKLKQNKKFKMSPTKTPNQ